MTLEEFGSKLKRSQEETRRLARAELAALRARVARTEELERDALHKFLGECAARGLRRVDGPGEKQGLQDAPSRGHAHDLFSGRTLAFTGGHLRRTLRGPSLSALR